MRETGMVIRRDSKRSDPEPGHSIVTHFKASDTISRDGVGAGGGTRWQGKSLDLHTPSFLALKGTGE